MYNKGNNENNCISENFINLRPLAISAIALATGVAFCYAALFYGVHLAFAFLSLIPCAVYLIAARKKIRAVIIFFLFLTFLGIGMGSFALKIETYGNQSFSEGNYVVSGEITEYTEGENYVRIVLKDVFADEKPLDGKLQANVYVSVVNVREGMKVRFSAELTPMGSAYRYNAFYADMVLDNIKYNATVSEVPVLVGEGNNPLVFVRNRIKDVLCENLSEEQAALAYALTTGNTSGIEEGLLSSVRYGGVAHLFAVSGLHIGIVYGALVWLFKRLKSPKAVRFLLPIAATLLFSGVCGFSASSLRAFLICASIAICSLFGIRTDGPEKAGFSCGVLLLINPVYLFSVGFQLSFGAYIAIVVLAPNLQKLFLPIYNRFPALKTPASTLSVMLSVQLCLFPVTLNTFGYVSVWGLFLNLLIIPLFSLYFPVLLLGVFLSCLLPSVAGVLLFLPGTVLSLFALFFNTIDFSVPLIQGFYLGMVAFICFYVLLLSASGRINLKRRFLSAIIGFLSAVFLVETYFGNVTTAGEYRIKQLCYYNDFCAALVCSHDANILLINGEIPYARMQTFLCRNGGDVDGVIVASKDVNACVNTLLSLQFDTVYVRQGESVELQTKTVIASNEFSVDGVTYVFETNDTVSFTCDGVKGVFNDVGYNADFAIFSAEVRDGLIFTINCGILKVSR